MVTLPNSMDRMLAHREGEKIVQKDAVLIELIASLVLDPCKTTMA